MVQVTKEEKEMIKEKYPDVYIIRTMKQKSKRHHYYCEEVRPAMNYLRKIRNENGTAVYGDTKGGGYGTRQERKRNRTRTS